MTAKRLVAFAWRESRFARRRLFLFLSAISLGVAALVAVQGFATNLQRGVREEARALLGADLRLSSRQPFGPRTETLLDSLRGGGVAVSRMTSFASMALLPRTGFTRLVQVRAPEPGYPFYGTIETSPAGVWNQLARGRSAIVDPALLTALRARIGDSISIGEARFVIVGTLTKVPGDTEIASTFAPRIYLPAAALGETALLGFGSRVDYEAFLRVPARTPLTPLIEGHERMFRAERVRTETADEQQADLERALGRLTDFLGLVGAFALLLGGIGVASAMGAYMALKSDVVAVLRCIGATSREVLAIYLIQAAGMGLAGALVGVAIGSAVQWVLPHLLEGLLPVEVAIRTDWLALTTGTAVGVWTALAFAALPLLAVRRVSPLGALRRRVQAVEAPERDHLRFVVWGLLAVTTVVMLSLQVGSAMLGAQLAAGVGAALAGLWGSAWLFMRGARLYPRHRLAYPVRQGLANLFRPGNQTRTVAVALGFGVFLLATLLLVQHNLLRPLRTENSSTRANLLLWDVQADQAEGVGSLLGTRGFPVLQRAPIVPMRISSLNGEEVRPWGEDEMEGDTLTGAGERGREGDRDRGDEDGRPARWALRREYRSTYRDTLVHSEEMLAAGRCREGSGRGIVVDRSPEGLPGGPLFARECAGLGGAPGEAYPVSLEADLAGDLRVAIGDRITWDVQGVRIPTVITALRRVDWGRFEPNFFAVFPSSALTGAPQTWVMLTRVDSADDRAVLQREIVERYPNVSALDLTQVQRALEEVIARVSLVIRFLAGFSVATGLIVLLGAVSTSRIQRIRESVLLKTLGASRRQVAAILFTEYLLLSLLAVLTGLALALVAGWALSRWFFELEFEAAPLALALLGGAVTLLAVTVALWASREVFRHTPLEALREE